MEFVILPRNAGKSTRMRLWLESSPDTRALITFSGQEAARMRREYEAWNPGEPVPTIISAGSRDQLRGRRDITEIGIDNTELVLAGIFGIKVGAVSFNLGDL